MEDTQINGKQAPKFASTENMDLMILDDNKKHSPMDVDLRGSPSVQDGGDDPQVPVDMRIASLEMFCKEASRSFFSETRLVSHQINSYNDFVSHGLQKIFDSLGEITVEPDYVPKKADVRIRRHATIKFGGVKLEEPIFWIDNNDLDKQYVKLKPKHARLQKMTYSSKMKVEMTVQVYTLTTSDKAKTGHDTCIQRKDIMKETKWVNIGNLPVMVNSNLCWLHKLQESDCMYDFGGYFLIKGMEKVFVAEEQRCLSRVWINDSPIWDACYLSEIQREKIYVKLVDSKDGFRKVINLSFLGITIPIWIMFFSLGVSSDKEAYDMINIQECDASLVNLISATIIESHEQCDDFRVGGRASQYVDNLIRKTKFPPKESFDEYIDRYMFPDVSGNRGKALFLGYMVRCLLMAYSGKRKCDNKDDFRNKRLDLACELLRRELWVHVKHAERRMVKVMQRDLSADGDLQDLECYVDSSIVTNGLNRAFSTGSWRHPYKRERCSGIVATLRRTNPLQMMSDLRKTRQWVAYSGKAGDARYPNPSYWGKLCFLSTPDGENCGFVKNLAITAVVSSVSRKPFVDILVSCGMKKLDELLLHEISGKDIIFLNGTLLGVCANPGEFVLHFRTMRRNKQIDPQVEIKWDKQNKEKPLFKTVAADCLDKRDDTSESKHEFTRPEYFNGQNAIVSISVHHGYNQEDSLVLNRASLERGMFRTQHFKTYKALAENKEVTNRLKYKEKVDFGKMPSKRGRVDSIDIDGMPYIGASLQSGDIIIGKMSASGEDHCIKLMHTEKGMVEKVVLSCNDDGKNSAVVTLRQTRSPCVGDKFASMHGQKGVVGLLDSQENFPFTLQGMVPDIVINPHGFPTRQTPGQLLEAALGKGIALGGMIQYATPFTTPSVESITEQLHRAGFSRWGGESVVNGCTGERMRSLVFMGPTFYQRLIHMAEDKVKFRNNGPVHPLTRQPVEDKRRYGGVKFGEMERDCLLGHGAAANLHERLFLLSDMSRLHVTGPYCVFCKSAENLVRVAVPYGAKMLYQELFSMGICLKFETQLG
ncbi:hypothetical protein GUJ93_ZPchr0012g19806 [Zizania palustris]|uniref:DNA-directed RNA polymerase subunit beta n=1 Tax=Zizania palustris TaxID=103762 RepID=A0A8J5WR09_ZIZPA|nr:hypothetical protein GUJ93_ZPchr0012g19806 [Zizania palustris]